MSTDLLHDIAFVTGDVLAAVWFFLCLARMQAAWEHSQGQTALLRYKLTTTARQLLGCLQEVEKIEHEIKVVEEDATAATKAQAARREALAKTPPPPPPEIHVGAEFPSSRRDVAWIAYFMRSKDEGPRQPFERAPKSTLLWAPDFQAAVSRARQILADYKAYDVEVVRRFAEPPAEPAAP